MSFEVTEKAYNTRLGNIPAKAVLVLIADQVNATGYGWPSLEFIAHATEVKIRTVQRIVRVFIKLKLLEKRDRGYRHTPGLQINMEKIGGDIAGEFALLYSEDEDKLSTERLRDAEENPNQNVSETLENVSETLENVSETLPPHPLIGRPVIDPLKTHPRKPPTLPSGNSGRERSQEQKHACENCVDSVMQACGFTSRRLRPVLQAQLEQESDKGVAPASAALAMMFAWKKYTTQGERLRFKWGVIRFFAEGYWREPESWGWDFQAIQVLTVRRF